MKNEVKISVKSNDELIHWTVKVENLEKFKKSLENFLKENTEIVEKNNEQNTPITRCLQGWVAEGNFL